MNQNTRPDLSSLETKEMTLSESIVANSGYNFDYPISESHIVGLLDIMQKQLEPNWQKVEKGKQPEDGYYWVIVKGKLTTATVNPLFLPKHTRGFWQYSDSSHDEKVYPSHYLKYSEGTPRLPKSDHISAGYCQMREGGEQNG